jgi:hypothetical protein
VLKGEFAKLRPRIGELVAVKYEGMVEPRGGGAPYAAYRVVVDRPGAVADWGDGVDAPPATPAPVTDRRPELRVPDKRYEARHLTARDGGG